MATQNLGRVKIVWKGEYNSATAYVVDDAVSYEGSSYVCIQNATNKVPTNTSYWNVIAEKGDTGATGASPTITASATTDGTSSTTPTVNVTKSGTDENPNFAFAFTGLKGAKGDKGDTGASGDLAWDDVSKSVQKNLLKNISKTATINGITFTVNADGSVTVNGTASAKATFGGLFDYKLEAGKTYILTDGVGTAGGNWDLWISGHSTGTPSSATWTQDVDATFTATGGITVQNGKTINNMVVKPMVRLASIANADYKPYIPNNTELVDWSSYAVLGAKNLLPNTAKSGTAATNVNYIVNSDGSITANGTPAGDDVIAVNTTGYFLTTDDIGKNETILTGAPTGSSATTYCLVAIIRPKTGGSATNLYFDYGEGVKIRALTDTERLEVRINLITGKQLDNKIFYPMLRLASDPDDTYAPYAMTNKELTEEKKDKKLIRVSGVSVDTLLDNARYFCNGNMTGLPSGNYGYLDVFKEQDGNNFAYLQVFYPAGIVGKIYTRRYWDGAWSSWYEFTGTVVS